MLNVQVLKLNKINEPKAAKIIKRQPHARFDENGPTRSHYHYRAHVAELCTITSPKSLFGRAGPEPVILFEIASKASKSSFSYGSGQK